MIIAYDKGTGGLQVCHMNYCSLVVVKHQVLGSVEMNCRSRERKLIYSARGLYVVVN